MQLERKRHHNLWRLSRELEEYFFGFGPAPRDDRRNGTRFHGNRAQATDGRVTIEQFPIAERIEQIDTMTIAARRKHCTNSDAGSRAMPCRKGVSAIRSRTLLCH